MKITFTITKELVHRFAEITSDKNSLHLNEEISRKFRYRKPVVHGMLPFSFLLFLQSEFPDKTIYITQIKAKFKVPIFPGFKISLSVTYHKLEKCSYKFEAKWYNEKNHTELITSTGEFFLSKEDRKESVSFIHKTRRSYVNESISENLYTIESLSNQTEYFDFEIDPTLSDHYGKILLDATRPTPRNLAFSSTNTNLTATLLLSTLVGMKLPGRYATFIDFAISFRKELILSCNYRIKGTVKKIYPSSGKIKLQLSIASDNDEYASGTANVLINPAPKETISCREICDVYLDLGVKEKVVLITGASRGIGAATAKLFAMHGAKIIINYYQGINDAHSIVEEIVAYGGEAISLQCDIRDKKHVTHMIAEAVDRFGTIDVLVNNAVKEFLPKEVLDLEWEDYLEELEVSLQGMHNCCREIIPIFKQKKQGKIIALSSTIVDCPVSGHNRYITIKSAVVGYIRSLAKDLGKYNIQANLVEPSMTETDLLSNMPTSFIMKLGEEKEFGRNLYPIEVAQSILFLASSWSNPLTGQRIVLNLGEPPFL